MRRSFRSMLCPTVNKAESSALIADRIRVTATSLGLPVCVLLGSVVEQIRAISRTASCVPAIRSLRQNDCVGPYGLYDRVLLFVIHKL